MPLPFRPGDRPLLHLGLLGATLLTTTGTFFFVFEGGLAALAKGGLPGAVEALSSSLVFSLSLLAILGSHEMGHYVLARVHRVDTSLPYFIPVPLLGVGTLGAVIRIRGRIPDRNALVDIGAAGPLAGLAIAVPVLLYGLAHSHITAAPIQPPRLLPGDNSLWVLVPKLVSYVTEKLAGTYTPPPVPIRETLIFGDNLLMMGLQRLVLGPLPPGHDVIAHPMVIAGWFGLLVTMLNLIPLGQLDGGHLTFALFGRHAQLIGKLMALAMASLCLFFSVGWLLWLVVTAKIIGFRHPEVLEPERPLSPGRKWVCAASAVALLVCVMPIPITQVLV